MDFSQSLFDILGVFIAFICIILLLSLVVTSMIQAIQAFLRLRARNLKKGLQSIIENLYGKNSDDAGKLALKVLHAKNICFLGRINERPDISLKRFLGPPVSYINPGDLPRAFKHAGLDDAEDEARAKEIKASFDKLWNQLENRFLLRIRFITIVCSIVVAGYFQISTPDLLKKLSTNKAWQDQVTAAVKGVQGPVAESQGKAMSQKALADLAVEYPEVQKKIETLGSIGPDRASIVAGLETILADTGERKAEIIDRYNALLYVMMTEQIDAAAKKTGETVGTLARIDINGWPQKWNFYYDGSVQVRNIVGVLLTAVLLSMGAPFWFERLKEAVKLRDILSKGIKIEDDKKTDGSGKKQDGGTA